MQNDRSERAIVTLNRGVAHGRAAVTLAVTLAASVASASPAEGLGETQFRSALQPTIGRLREGTRIVDRLGTFTITAKQAVFHTSDGKMQLGGLPNLNLERVISTLQDGAGGLVWSVSGLVTEYHGSNFLLITRAVLKSKESSRSSRIGQPTHSGRGLRQRLEGKTPTTQRPVPHARPAAQWGPQPPGPIQNQRSPRVSDPAERVDRRSPESG
jgi:hypothetical protein